MHDRGHRAIDVAKDADLREEVQKLLVVDELVLVELVQPRQEDGHQHMLMLHVVLVEGQLDLGHARQHAQQELEQGRHCKLTEDYRSLCKRD